MSIQLVLLKSGEDVIADVKELRDDKDELMSYVFKDPYKIKITMPQVLMETKSKPKHEAAFYKWMPLSKESDIIVNKDWIVCITDPIDTIKTLYEERINERRRSNDSNESGNGRDGGTRGSGDGGATESDSSSLLSESTDNSV
tara:strand:+ start:183 stop:611 length:429 start_codon:yes stop_codon:yes gene_type:complete